MTTKQRYGGEEPIPNSLFLDKLNDAKCVAIEMLMIISIERLPKIYDSPKVHPFQTLNIASNFTKCSPVIQKCQDYLSKVSKMDLYTIPVLEYKEMQKKLEIKAKEALKTMSKNLLMSSDIKVSIQGSREGSPVSVQKVERFDPKIENTPEKMISVLEKLIFEYSKGYAPTTLYHIDVFSIDKVYKIVGGFIIHPETHSSCYLLMQQSLSGPAQTVFRSFTNLRAFMFFAFLMDNRVNPSSLLFGSRFSNDMSVYLQSIACSLMIHRPTTINSNAMTWLIDKVVDDGSSEIIASMAADAVTRYLMLANSDEVKIQESRQSLMCQMLDIVVGGRKANEAIKISALPIRLSTIKYPRLARRLSHDHGDPPRSMDKSVDRMQAPVDMSPRGSNRSMSEMLDVRLLSDIDHFDGHVDDANILRDTDLRAYFIKSFIPFPKFSVISHLREYSMQIISQLQAAPVSMHILSEKQLSQRSLKNNKTLKTQDIADKFKKLIHQDSIELDGKTNAYAKNRLLVDNGYSPRKSLRSLTKLDKLPKSRHHQAPLTSILHGLSNYLQTADANHSRQAAVSRHRLPDIGIRHRPAASHSPSKLAAIIRSTTAADAVPIAGKHPMPRTNSRRHTASRLDKLMPTIMILPADSRTRAIDNKAKGFFTRIKSVVGRHAPVHASRNHIDGSAARDYLSCKVDSEWHASDTVLLTIIKRSITDELDKHKNICWLHVLNGEENKIRDIKTSMPQSLCNEALAKALLQVLGSD